MSTDRLESRGLFLGKGRSRESTIGMAACLVGLAVIPFIQVRVWAVLLVLLPLTAYLMRRMFGRDAYTFGYWLGMREGPAAENFNPPNDTDFHPAVVSRLVGRRSSLGLTRLGYVHGFEDCLVGVDESADYVKRGVANLVREQAYRDLRWWRRVYP